MTFWCTKRSFKCTFSHMCYTPIFSPPPSRRSHYSVTWKIEIRCESQHSGSARKKEIMPSGGAFLQEFPKWLFFWIHGCFPAPLTRLLATTSIVERKWFSPWHSATSSSVCVISLLSSAYVCSGVCVCYCYVCVLIPCRHDGAKAAAVLGLGWYTIGISYKSSSSFLVAAFLTFPLSLDGNSMRLLADMDQYFHHHHLWLPSWRRIPDWMYS